MKLCVVTGSSGLVGSESVKFYCNKGYTVIGIDNDMRMYFFGTSTLMIKDQLAKTYKEQYIHHSVDIRDRSALEAIFKYYNKDILCIIHCAAQPSHDWAAKEPHTDFGINAVGTLNMLEAARAYCPKASFIFMSTNKVYGDNPNTLHIVERDTRYDVECDGIDETMSLDHCKHSIFGVSKLAADSMVQEYGRYFGMNTVVFRGGCITGPNHQGAQLHGFLSYIVKCIVENKHYTIFGYKGKQVRDNIHSYDLVNAFWNYHMNPTPGAVYNMGGGRENSLSILETIQKINTMTHKGWNDYEYVDESRSGDHIWYITNYSKFARDYPNWKIHYPIDRILTDSLCAISKSTMTAVLMGGVGNQLFQIAAAYSISRKLHMNLQFIKNQFGGCVQGSHPSKYYNNLLAKLTFVEGMPPCNIIHEMQWTYCPIVGHVLPIIQADPTSHVALNGYFQSDLYFKDYSVEIKELFTPALGIIGYLEAHSDIFTHYPELKQNNDYAFIGVRRGDYVTKADYHNPCGMTYYTKAMKTLNKERYYIVTDDIAWVKKQFVGDMFRYIELKDDLHQLLASALFKSYIISNSSFYWWGSFLSIYDSPRIIAPDKWMFGKNVKKEQYWSVYRDGMEVLERPIEAE